MYLVIYVHVNKHSYIHTYVHMYVVHFEYTYVHSKRFKCNYLCICNNCITLVLVVCINSAHKLRPLKYMILWHGIFLKNQNLNFYDNVMLTFEVIMHNNYVININHLIALNKNIRHLRA